MGVESVRVPQCCDVHKVPRLVDIIISKEGKIGMGRRNLDGG